MKKNPLCCDEGILLRIAKNDPLAFKVFYNAYYYTLYRYTYYFETNRELRNDIISDVFMSVWVARENLPNIKNINNYLFISVRNQVLKYKRDKIAHLSVSIDSYENLTEDNLDNAQVDLEKKELSQTVEMAVNSLPERCKLIYLLVKEEGMQYSEVAEMLSISKKTVQAQMIIAVKKLGQAIRNVYQHNGINS